MKAWLKFYVPFVLAAGIIIGWAVFFYYISPTALVQKIGIQNSYLVAFFLAVICGFSSLTGATFYIALAALSHGGANWIILGLVGGLGLCVSDFAFYFVISKGTHVVDKHWVKLSTFIKKWIEKVPLGVMYGVIFLYSAFAPIPNDIILVALAVGRTSFRKIAWVLFAGDMTSTIILAYLSR
jgi:hypothetical protein